jgi:hypothetical protein
MDWIVFKIARFTIWVQIFYHQSFFFRLVYPSGKVLRKYI